jgi:hypothetical protein
MDRVGRYYRADFLAGVDECREAADKHRREMDETESGVWQPALLFATKLDLTSRRLIVASGTGDFSLVTATWSVDYVVSAFSTIHRCYGGQGQLFQPAPWWHVIDSLKLTIGSHIAPSSRVAGSESYPLC